MPPGAVTFAGSFLCAMCLERQELACGGGHGLVDVAAVRGAPPPGALLCTPRPVVC